MQMGGEQQNGQLPLPDKTKTSAAWSFSSPTTKPLLLFFFCYSSSSSLGKRTIPDFHTCLCSCVRGTTSSLKREGDDPGKKEWKTERNTGIVSFVIGSRVVSGQSAGQTAGTPLFSEHQKLILIARLVVMSQMRTALTCAWTHQMKWSCSLSCRRQTVESLRINQAHQEASAPSSTLTPRKCWIRSSMHSNRQRPLV